MINCIIGLRSGTHHIPPLPPAAQLAQMAAMLQEVYGPQELIHESVIWLRRNARPLSGALLRSDLESGARDAPGVAVLSW